MKANLEAFRCPDATIIMRKKIDDFVKSKDEPSLLLSSIEPSLENNLKAFIEHNSLPISIQKIESTGISEQKRKEWLAHFDEEDFEDVSEVKHFHITKHQTA